MQKETAIGICRKCVEQVLRRGRKSYIENPAIQFTQKAKDGGFDMLSEDEYKVLLAETEELSRLWGGRSRRTAGDLLLSILESVPDVSGYRVDVLAGALASVLCGPAETDRPHDAPEGCTPIGLTPDDWTPDDIVAAAAGADREIPFDGAPLGTFPEQFPERSPAEIRDMIASRVLGQPEAARAAALIVHNHLAGRRTNAVLAGPSGCGKSEIWRVLAREYPGLVRVVDFSRFASEGWAGSLHVRDIFEGMDRETFQQHGMIAVLDEADKILCERAVGSGGTDHHVLLQNDLLKIMDGDVVEFGEEGKRSPLSVDCSRVSVVMLGAFEKLREGQARAAKRIGFGQAPTPTPPGDGHSGIGYDDLITAGMRREIAGRVNRIVELGPLSADDYKAILRGPVLDRVQEAVGCKVSIDGATAGVLAERAAASGLGVRWMRSAVLNAIDDMLFDEPDTAVREIDLSGRLP